LYGRGGFLTAYVCAFLATGCRSEAASVLAPILRCSCLLADLRAGSVEMAGHFVADVALVVWLGRTNCRRCAVSSVALVVVGDGFGRIAAFHSIDLFLAALNADDAAASGLVRPS